MGDVLLCTTTGCMLVGSITKGDGTTTSYAKPYRAHARVYIERHNTSGGGVYPYRAPYLYYYGSLRVSR